MALYNSHTDKQLADFLKGGDTEAFTEIYERYWERLLTYAMRAVKERDAAEDMVQELFISIWRRRFELNVQLELSTYLYNSIRYMTLRHIERNMARSEHVRRLTDGLGTSGANETAEIENEIFAGELQDRVEALVRQLPDRMREVYLLSRRDHLSHREIAQRMAISEETVKKQIYKTLQIIRRGLGLLSIALTLFKNIY